MSDLSIPFDAQTSEVSGAFALVDVLFDLAVPRLSLGIIERETRQREAARVLDRLGCPIAVFGVEPEPELQNQAWRELIGAAPARVLARIAEVAASGTAQQIPDLAIDHADRLRYFTAVVRPRRGKLGAPKCGVVVVCTDVTEEVLARKLEIRPESLVWSGGLGSGAGYWNEAWRRVIGVMDWQAAVHPDDLARCRGALAEASERLSSVEVEARLRRAGGDYRWFRIQFIVDTTDDRWFGMAVDIHEAHMLVAERNELLTAARSARAEAERAIRLRDEFLATVSHELRAPVSTMLLWEKLLREHPDPDMQVQALDAIRQSALAQSRLVGDLLDVARAASGKLYVDLRVIAAAPVIDDAITAASPHARTRRITLSHQAPDGAMVEADAARLRQVLDNLLANAIKFTDPGGRVTLSARAEQATLVIEIQDTGRGIAPDALELIFEPFQQTGDVRGGRHAGLGLGLAISRQLVALHGGTLMASSPGIGHGATMTIRLPLSHKRARVPTAPFGAEEAGALRGARVLVIDDDTRLRDALVILLECAGVSVEAAGSALRGRAALQRKPVDVIICDIAMPKEDGYQFVRTLRATGNRTPVIALTAHALEGDAERAAEAGFDLHLAKPVNFEQLVTSIGSLLPAPESVGS